MVPYLKNIMDRENIRDAAVNEALAETPDLAKTTEGFIQRVSQKFFEKQMTMFPSYCQETYQVNFLHNKELEEGGIKGKYTDSYGWSKDRTMKSKWIIPKTLQLFMCNMVYKEFWDDSNAKVRDSFMRQICSGNCNFEYEQLLQKVILYYGANYKDAGKRIIT